MVSLIKTLTSSIYSHLPTIRSASQAPKIPKTLEGLPQQTLLKAQEKSDKTFQATRVSPVAKTDRTKAPATTSTLKRIAACALAIFLLMSSGQLVASSQVPSKAIWQPYTSIDAVNPLHAFYERSDICLSPSRYSMQSPELIPSMDISFLEMIKVTPMGKTLSEDFYSSKNQQTIQAATDLIAFGQGGELITPTFMNTYQGKVLREFFSLAVKANYGKDEAEVISKINKELGGGLCHGTTLSVMKHLSNSNTIINPHELYNDIIFYQVISLFQSILSECKYNINEKLIELAVTEENQQQIDEQTGLLNQREELLNSIYKEYFQFPKLTFLLTLNQEFISYHKERGPENSLESVSSRFKELIESNPDAKYLPIEIHFSEGNNHSVLIGLEDDQFFLFDIMGREPPEDMSMLEQVYSPYNTWLNFESRESCIAGAIQYIVEKYFNSEAETHGAIEVIGYRSSSI